MPTPQAAEEAGRTPSAFTHIHDLNIIEGPRIFLPGEIPDPTPGATHGRVMSPEGVPFYAVVSWAEYGREEAPECYVNIHYLGLDEAQTRICLDIFPAAFLRPIATFDRAVRPWECLGATEQWYDPEHVGATFLDEHGKDIAHPDRQTARLSLSWTMWHDDGHDQSHLHVLTLGTSQVDAFLRGFPFDLLQPVLHRAAARERKHNADTRWS